MELKIESGIPIPEREHLSVKVQRAIEQMKVGDSIALPRDVFGRYELNYRAIAAWVQARVIVAQDPNSPRDNRLWRIE